MLEPRLDPGLAQEPRRLVLAGMRRAQPLDRDIATDAQVVREHHFADAAAPDHLAHRVAGQHPRLRLAAVQASIAVAHEGVGLG